MSVSDGAVNSLFPEGLYMCVCVSVCVCMCVRVSVPAYYSLGPLVFDPTFCSVEVLCELEYNSVSTVAQIQCRHTHTHTQTHRHTHTYTYL